MLSMSFFSVQRLFKANSFIDLIYSHLMLVSPHYTPYFHSANVTQLKRINPLEPAAAASVVARCPESLAVHVTLLAASMPRIMTNVGTFSLTNRGFCVCARVCVFVLGRGGSGCDTQHLVCCF